MWFAAFDAPKKIQLHRKARWSNNRWRSFQLYNTNALGKKSIDVENKTYTHCKIYENIKAAYKPHFMMNQQAITAFELLNELVKKIR
jgi:hypothetical protein